MGSIMSKCLWQDQRVPHEAPSAHEPNNRETFIVIHCITWSIFGCTTGSTWRVRKRECLILLKSNLSRGISQLHPDWEGLPCSYIRSSKVKALHFWVWGETHFKCEPFEIYIIPPCTFRKDCKVGCDSTTILCWICATKSGKWLSLSRFLSGSSGSWWFTFSNRFAWWTSNASRSTEEMGNVLRWRF